MGKVADCSDYSDAMRLLKLCIYTIQLFGGAINGLKWTLMSHTDKLQSSRRIQRVQKRNYHEENDRCNVILWVTSLSWRHTGHLNVMNSPAPVSSTGTFSARQSIVAVYENDKAHPALQTEFQKHFCALCIESRYVPQICLDTSLF